MTKPAIVIAREVLRVLQHVREEGQGPSHQQSAWPKLTVVLHTRSHLIVGAVSGTGPSQSLRDLAPAMRQAASIMPLGTMLADAGYNAENSQHL